MVTVCVVPPTCNEKSAVVVPPTCTVAIWILAVNPGASAFTSYSPGRRLSTVKTPAALLPAVRTGGPVGDCHGGVRKHGTLLVPDGALNRTGGVLSRRAGNQHHGAQQQ